MEPWLSLCTGIGTSYATHHFALAALKQQDVQTKTRGTQLEDALLAGGIAALVAYMTHPQPEWAFLVGIPVATLVYASIAEIPALRTSLANPTPTLLAVGGILGIAVVGLYGWSVYSMPEQRLVALSLTGMIVAWIASLWLQKHLDNDVLQKPTVHVHHWMIGVALIGMFGPFSYTGHLPSAVMVTIGLALIIHAASVYRITSGACSHATNCRV